MKPALPVRATTKPPADAAESPTLPPGAPGWVTPELITQTIDAWQPYYRFSLTAHDALEILLNVSQLFEQLESSIQ